MEMKKLTKVIIREYGKDLAVFYATTKTEMFQKINALGLLGRGMIITKHE